MSLASRSRFPAYAGPLLFVLTSLVASGCGRIGLELYPEDAGQVDSDADLDAGELDAGEDLDAAHDAGEDGGPPDLDGCIQSELGGCASCIGDAYVPSVPSCGVGYCKTASTESKCTNGIEYMCVPGNPRALNDTTCDGVDDDCNGVADEEFVPSMTTCGLGVCASSGMLTCERGKPKDSCVAGPPNSSSDDATGTGNGLDDNCDGRVDEDVSSCNAKPLEFGAGVHMNITAPPGCGSATIQLWGGAGAAGGEAGIAGVEQGGHGGSGGYARGTVLLSGPLTLYVGNGGIGIGNSAVFNQCAMMTGAGGVNPGSNSYSGGSGGIGDGAAGADGMVAGGGNGATNTVASSGGRGYYGGGGGGAGYLSAINGAGSGGGGAGAATIALVNGMRVLVAGGGGGGGGAGTTFYNFGERGGSGGEGCAGSGTAGASPRTGGGGGGGVCVGMVTSSGTNGLPANVMLLPPGVATGTDKNCTNGGNGYAIVTFAR